jgi:hypothetical protein
MTKYTPAVSVFLISPDLKVCSTAASRGATWPKMSVSISRVTLSPSMWIPNKRGSLEAERFRPIEGCTRVRVRNQEKKTNSGLWWEKLRTKSS